MCAIDEIVLYAPCEMLRGRVQWIDAPGCGDADAFKIRKCMHVVWVVLMWLLPRGEGA